MVKSKKTNNIQVSTGHLSTILPEKECAKDILYIYMFPLRMIILCASSDTPPKCELPRFFNALVYAKIYRNFCFSPPNQKYIQVFLRKRN